MSANVVSLTGNQLALLALPWYVLQTTGSPARVGLAGAIEAAGIILSSFLGGALVDRIGFRRSSVLADCASGISIALIPLFDHVFGLAFWELLLLILCVAMFNTPGSTARGSMLPDLAELAQMRLERATSLNEGIRNFASLGGPLLAGLLIATISARNVLWVDAVSFGLSAIMVATLTPTSVPQTGQPERRYIEAVREGIQFIQADRIIRSLALIASYVNLVGAALMAVLLPVVAQRIFDSSIALGVLIAADGGGALVGTVVFGLVGHRWPRRPALITAFSISFLALAALAATPGLTLSAITLVLDGIAFGIIGPLTFTVYQERVPAPLRGRVFGALFALHRLATPLGVILAGYLIQIFSLTSALVSVAALSLLMPAMILAAPALRVMDRPEARVPRRNSQSGQPDRSRS